MQPALLIFTFSFSFFPFHFLFRVSFMPFLAASALLHATVWNLKYIYIYTHTLLHPLQVACLRLIYGSIARGLNAEAVLWEAHATRCVQGACMPLREGRQVRAHRHVWRPAHALWIPQPSGKQMDLYAPPRTSNCLEYEAVVCRHVFVKPTEVLVAPMHFHGTLSASVLECGFRPLQEHLSLWWKMEALSH